jgi:DNA-directed RNA polymerase specialized sigma24 family protein
VSQQLARARERNTRQLAEIREQEVRVDQALHDYVAATEQIAVADRECEEKVAHLEARIRQVRAERDERVADVRAARADAVLTIHTAGRTVKQVAELLELPVKTARQWIGQARTRGAGDAPISTGAETGAITYREPAADRDMDRDARQ